jgi:hypothetical protein
LVSPGSFKQPRGGERHSGSKPSARAAAAAPAALARSAEKIVSARRSIQASSAARLPRSRASYAPAVIVSASDAANAWRHLARTGDARNAFASLIAPAYHTAGSPPTSARTRTTNGGEACTQSDPAELLAAIDGRIRERDQRGACLAARRTSLAGTSSGSAGSCCRDPSRRCRTAR